MTVEIAVADVVYREDLYPRIKHDPALVQRYAANLEVLPPIEVNQHNILIDGWHRWTAHRKAEADTIHATVTETPSDVELFALAIERNARHGWQLDESSKKLSAIKLYADGTGKTKDEIAQLIGVTGRMVRGYLEDTDKRLREARDQRILDLYLLGWTHDEIAEDVADLSVDGVRKTLPGITEGLPKVRQVAAEHGEAEWTPPIYNVWAYGTKSNEVGHFGNSEQRIVDNLLWLYTQPFDLVVDPFAGGGSTVDVCRKRLRRCWASDRKPIPEREDEIRKLDLLTDGLPPLHRRWSDVTLTYLDPPYWRQAAGQYSDDPTDLANLSLEEFTKEQARIVRKIGEKQSRGAIAMLMQPTQWLSDDRRFTDHIFDLVKAVGNKHLRVVNRVSAPYQSQQYNPQQVEWAKENRQLLVLTRELVIWRVSR